MLLYEDKKGPITTKTHGEWGFIMVISMGKDRGGSKIKYSKCV
jgi:hypothetical protein